MSGSDRNSDEGVFVCSLSSSPLVQTFQRLLTTHFPVRRPEYVFDCLPIMCSFLIYILPATHFGRCLNDLQTQCAKFDAAPLPQAVDVVYVASADYAEAPTAMTREMQVICVMPAGCSIAPQAAGPNMV